jgi:hypothetical protein
MAMRMPISRVRRPAAYDFNDQVARAHRAIVIELVVCADVVNRLVRIQRMNRLAQGRGQTRGIAEGFSQQHHARLGTLRLRKIYKFSRGLADPQIFDRLRNAYNLYPRAIVILQEKSFSDSVLPRPVMFGDFFVDDRNPGRRVRVCRHEAATAQNRDALRIEVTLAHIVREQRDILFLLRELVALRDDRGTVKSVVAHRYAVGQRRGFHPRHRPRPLHQQMEKLLGLRVAVVHQPRIKRQHQ